MFASPTVACLFCSHLNPEGAHFCNNCGTQMHLQPCDRCGAIDSRASKSCHKCGAEFAPAHPDPVHSFPEPPQADVAVSFEKGATATGSRRAWLVALRVSLIAAIGVAAIYYSGQTGQSAQLARKQAAMQRVPAGFDAPSAATVAASAAAAAPIDSASAGTTLTLAAVAPGLAEAPSFAQSVTGAAMPVRPSSVTAAETSIRQDTAPRECPQAVAALGLCSQSTQHKEQ